MIAALGGRAQVVIRTIAQRALGCMCSGQGGVGSNMRLMSGAQPPIIEAPWAVTS